MSEKVCNFAPAFDKKGQMPSKKDRDLAQLVAHTSGGREVAGSSPVIPTDSKVEVADFQLLPFLLNTFLNTFSSFLSSRATKNRLSRN